MGMDVYGRNPSAPEGEYFRRNVWGWRPLAELCLNLAPEICGDCTYWHTNDGDGLNAKKSRALGDALQNMIATGVVPSYIAEREARLRALPDQPCKYCHQTGIRTDEVGRERGMPEQPITQDAHPRRGQTGWCNACNGVGHTSHSATSYHLDLEDVEEFATFLTYSGGFRIC